MSLPPAPIPIGRQYELAALAALKTVSEEMALLRTALPRVNDETLRPRMEDLAACIRTADALLAAQHGGLSQRLVDGLTDLRRLIELVDVPAEDEMFGRTEGLAAVRGAQGQVSLSLGRALRAAEKAGARPNLAGLADGVPEDLPRVLFAGRLAALSARLDTIVDRLDGLDAAEKAAGPNGPQSQFVSFFLGRMRVEVDLGRLSLTIGERSIDFPAILRTAEAMGRLTGDFLSTLKGWAGRISATVSLAAKELRSPVQKMVGGARATIWGLGWRTRSAEKDRSRENSEGQEAGKAFPPGFSLERVREMILAGEAAPESWVPWVIDLDFVGTSLSDLRPLRGLTALRRLRLGNRLDDVETLVVGPGDDVKDLPIFRLGKKNWNRNFAPPAAITDLTALGGLTSLEFLDLAGTPVADLTPLASLKELRYLDLTGTQVTDLSALASLTALNVLHLRGTQVRDAMPLFSLSALQYLDLNGTQIDDLSPLRNLAALQYLYLSGTSVDNIAPLSGLTALQYLYIRGTWVKDVSPLAKLGSLRYVDLVGTPVNDVTTLLHLKVLINGVQNRL